jgi:predicted HicB family RNase H-like nuclease
MSQQLSLELNDEVYADLQQKADAVGVTLTEWIIATLSDRSSILSSNFKFKIVAKGT